MYLRNSCAKYVLTLHISIFSFIDDFRNTFYYNSINQFRYSARHKRACRIRASLSQSLEFIRSYIIKHFFKEVQILTLRWDIKLLFTWATRAPQTVRTALGPPRDIGERQDSSWHPRRGVSQGSTTKRKVFLVLI